MFLPVSFLRKPIVVGNLRDLDMKVYLLNVYDIVSNQKWQERYFSFTELDIAIQKYSEHESIEIEVEEDWIDNDA